MITPRTARAFSCASCGRLGGADLFPSSRVDQFIDELGISRDDGHAFVSQVAERGPHESVVGILGLSLNETPHRFKVNGERLFTWCDMDSSSYRRCSSKLQVSNPNRRSAARRCGWRSVRRVRRHLTRLGRSSRSLSPTRTWRTRVPSRRFCNHTFFFASRQGT